MKKYFITGLVILLPLAVTIVLLAFIVNLLTQPFVGFIEQFLVGIPFFEKYRGTVHIFLQIVLLFGLFFFTVLLGFLARIVVFKSFLTFYDYILHRIPIIKTIYKATQQVIRTIFGSTSRSFKQVVMVPFPTHGSYCIGLVSSPAPSLCEKTVGAPLITVFVPTTPNPTSGFLIMYKEDEAIYLDMKIEEAFKYIISCGVITSDGVDLPSEISP
ncbi:MAG: DUF502 domain-containing protein [Chlamydiales bacterium]|nr:DUF502 domain-containing protein [Chlamydiales bacterium]